MRRTLSGSAVKRAWSVALRTWRERLVLTGLVAAFLTWCEARIVTRVLLGASLERIVATRREALVLSRRKRRARCKAFVATGAE